MAALVKHGFALKGLKVSIKWAQVAHMAYKFKLRLRKKPKMEPKKGPTFDSSAESLAARGFLRQYKGYTPPENVEEDILSLSAKILGASNRHVELSDPDQRFQFLYACWKHTGHAIPNSLLHTVKTVGHTISFYKQPVNVHTPLDMMKEKELPPNLHIMYDYKRFNQDPNNAFGGHTAFPESNTIISGLRARKKYQNMYAKPPVHNWAKLVNWPYPVKD